MTNQPTPLGSRADRHGIKRFQITNIGRFPSLEIPLAPTEDTQSNITVLMGNNGAGKTSLLRALATSLSWLVARIRSEKGSGSPIDENDVKKQKALGIYRYRCA